MKKIFFCFISIAITLCILTGCNTPSSSSTNTPQATTDAFLKALQKQNYADGKTYYSENLDNMANFRNQIEKISPKLAQELFKKLADFSYTITSTELEPTNSKKALVGVTITAYDLGPSFESTVLDYIKSDIEMTFDGAKNEDIIKNAEATIVDEIINANTTFITTTNIHLTNSDGTWKLDKISDNPELINALSGNILHTIDNLSKTLNHSA